MNAENLKIPTHAEAQRNGKQGGKKSGEARRMKRDARKTLQSLLDGDFTKDGEKKSGREMLAVTLFEIALNPEHKQCISAQRLIYELVGEDKTPEEKKKIKQALELQKKEIELTQKKIDNLDGWE